MKYDCTITVSFSEMNLSAADNVSNLGGVELVHLETLMTISGNLKMMST